MILRGFLVNLMPGFLVRLFASPYVSGDSIEKGIAKADELWNKKGISSTLDLLGEEVFTREEVEENVAIYIELIEKLEGRSYTTVSVKPSALGSHESKEYLEENLRKILKKATEHEMEITLDMEDHTFTDLTLELYKKLLVDFPTWGTVLQSRLFRTMDDIKAMDDLKIRVRLCIGIYNEDKSIALTNKNEMKDEMLKMGQYMMDKGHFVEFATHDEKYLNIFLDIAKEKRYPHERLEFQQLMGVPMSAMQQKILDEGYAVRLYVPFATKWSSATPYLKRRLINNPKMAIYVLKNIFKK